MWGRKGGLGSPKEAPDEGCGKAIVRAEAPVRLEDEQGSASQRDGLVASPVGSCSGMRAGNVERWVTGLERSRRVIHIMNDLISPGLCPKDTVGGGSWKG